jgi:hypothetical protein
MNSAGKASLALWLEIHPSKLTNDACTHGITCVSEGNPVLDARIKHTRESPSHFSREPLVPTRKQTILSGVTPNRFAKSPRTSPLSPKDLLDIVATMNGHATTTHSA